MSEGARTLRVLAPRPSDFNFEVQHVNWTPRPADSESLGCAPIRLRSAVIGVGHLYSSDSGGSMFLMMM